MLEVSPNDLHLPLQATTINQLKMSSVDEKTCLKLGGILSIYIKVMG